MKVVVTVRADYERHHWWHPDLGAWLMALVLEDRYKMAVELVTGAGGYSASANLGAYNFMDKHPTAEWYCQIDNDTVPPGNLLRILDGVPDHVDILAPVVCMIRNTHVFPMQGWVAASENGIMFTPIEIGDPKGLQEVDRAGGGCWFIRRRVFEVMTRPYFRVEVDDETQAMVTSDDVYFQTRARELGFRLFCDPRFVASHYHTTDVSHPPAHRTGSFEIT